MPWVGLTPYATRLAESSWTQHTAPKHSSHRAKSSRNFMHVYLPVGRLETLDRAWTLATSRAIDIWSIEADDLALARSSIIRHPELSARDLLHLACCRRRGVERTHTFDRALRAAVEGG